MALNAKVGMDVTRNWYAIRLCKFFAMFLFRFVPLVFLLPFLSSSTTIRLIPSAAAASACRRKWILLGATITISSSHPNVLAFNSVDQTTTSSDHYTMLREKCRQGALASEQAIPGAYQQECMGLSMREIPLQISKNPPKRILLQVHQEATGAGSTGTVIWNSGLLLTRLLEELITNAVSDGKINDRFPLAKYSEMTVLELGTGTGVVSMVAAALGAARVIATDGNSRVVQLAKTNFDVNYQILGTNKVTAAVLPWGFLSALDYAEEADLVIGSDLTYFSGNWPALAETMATVVKRKNGIVLYLTLGHSGFSVAAETHGFLSVAAGYGLVPLVTPESMTGAYLTNLLWTKCMSPVEREMVSIAGGVRVLALVRKV